MQLLKQKCEGLLEVRDAYIHTYIHTYTYIVFKFTTNRSQAEKSNFNKQLNDVKEEVRFALCFLLCTVYMCVCMYAYTHRLATAKRNSSWRIAAPQMIRLPTRYVCMYVCIYVCMLGNSIVFMEYFILLPGRFQGNCQPAGR